MALREPKDLAWFLASYARDALERVEAKKELPGLASIKSALEEALGMKFDADKGEHFFRSTLVQTLFYGVFSSWVLWARQTPAPTGRFEWREAVWHLNVPFVSALYQQLAAPKQLQPLGLVELLDWTEATLNRIDNKQEFLQRFNDADAVQFFYEPFLEAFDPVLRKELGVWYTPSEVVAYMVARVDKALKEDLGVADGLASDNVYVLDPCCGTGAYVAAVLRRIDRTLADKGLRRPQGPDGQEGGAGARAGLRDHAGAVHRRAPAGGQRAAGARRQPHGGPRARQRLPHQRAHRLGADRHQAAAVPRAGGGAQEGREAQAGGADPGDPRQSSVQRLCRVTGEERDLSSYRRRSVRKPEGQGLNDLYVRFFRMAERRIVDKTGRGIVCFISNYSWLDGLSFTGMRERYLEAFDAIRIDCLNGDKYKTGKTTPDGKPDPSIFSTEHNREGIQVGTAIATLVRESEHTPASTVRLPPSVGHGETTGPRIERRSPSRRTCTSRSFRHLNLGCPSSLRQLAMAILSGRSSPELLPVSFPGVKTSRDDFLVGIDREELERRLDDYFDPKIIE